MLDTIKFALPPIKERDIGLDYDQIEPGYYFNLAEKDKDKNYIKKEQTTCRAEVALFPIVSIAVPMRLQELYATWLEFCTSLLNVDESEVWMRELPDKENFLIIYHPKRISTANIHYLQLIFVLVEEFGPDLINLMFMIWRNVKSPTMAEIFAAASYLYTFRRNVDVERVPDFSIKPPTIIVGSRFPFLGITNLAVRLPRDPWTFRRTEVGLEGSYIIPGISPATFPIKIEDLNIEAFTYYEVCLFSRMLLQAYIILHNAQKADKVKEVIPLDINMESRNVYTMVFKNTKELRQFITFHQDYIYSLPDVHNKLLVDCRYLFENL